MIRIVVTIIHLSQFVIHSWFMYHSVFAFQQSSLAETLWHQIKLLTKFSNWAMFCYLIPFVYFDFKNFKCSKINERYPKFINLLFQCMNPIIFLVMVSYQTLYYINPNLLFTEGFIPNEWQLVILFYQHFGNWALMLLDFILYEHQILLRSKKILFFCVYILVYFSIYGLYFYATGKHVYGFQQNLSIYKIIILNGSQFSILFIIDFMNQTITQSKRFKSIILENYFCHNELNNKLKKQN